MKGTVAGLAVTAVLAGGLSGCPIGKQDNTAKVTLTLTRDPVIEATGTDKAEIWIYRDNGDKPVYHDKDHPLAYSYKADLTFGQSVQLVATSDIPLVCSVSVDGKPRDDLTRSNKGQGTVQCGVGFPKRR